MPYRDNGFETPAGVFIYRPKDRPKTSNAPVIERKYICHNGLHHIISKTGCIYDCELLNACDGSCDDREETKPEAWLETDAHTAFKKAISLDVPTSEFVIKFSGLLFSVYWMVKAVVEFLKSHPSLVFLECGNGINPVCTVNGLDELIVQLICCFPVAVLYAYCIISDNHRLQEKRKKFAALKATAVRRRIELVPNVRVETATDEAAAPSAESAAQSPLAAHASHGST